MFGRITITSLFLLALGTLLIFAFGNESTYTTLTEELPLVDDEAATLMLSTDTWALFDPKTGEIIEGENTEVVLPIASVTKLATAAFVLESEQLDVPVTINWIDVAAERRAGKLQSGNTLTLRELLFPLLLESSNDAADAIQRTLGSRFWELRDALIADAALTNTQIVDASGISSGNISSISDLAKLYTYLESHHRYTLDVTTLGLKIGSEPGQGWVNNSPAHAFEGYAGGKHGYIPEAGRTFVGAFTLPESNAQIGIILLKSADLTADIQELLDYATIK